MNIFSHACLVILECNYAKQQYGSTCIVTRSLHASPNHTGAFHLLIRTPLSHYLSLLSESCVCEVANADWQECSSTAIPILVRVVKYILISL